MASLAVMADPLYCAPSTTSTPTLIPLMMRLRIGKFCGKADRAHGKFREHQPLGRDFRRQLSILATDRPRRRRSPSTAMVSPPAASAPLCAAVSMPRAMPLTMVRPACARSPRAAPLRPVRKAWDGACPPRRATMDCRSSTRPRANSSIGGSKISRSSLRIARVADRDQLRRPRPPSFPAARRRLRRCIRWRWIAPPRRETPAVSSSVREGAENRLRRAEAVEQFVGGARSQSGHEH